MNTRPPPTTDGAAVLANRQIDHREWCRALRDRLSAAGIHHLRIGDSKPHRGLSQTYVELFLMAGAEPGIVPTTIGELAKSLDADRKTVQSWIDDLEGLGLVTRLARNNQGLLLEVHEPERWKQAKVVRGDDQLELGLEGQRCADPAEKANAAAPVTMQIARSLGPDATPRSLGDAPKIAAVAAPTGGGLSPISSRPGLGSDSERPLTLHHSERDLNLSLALNPSVLLRKEERYTGSGVSSASDRGPASLDDMTASIMAAINCNNMAEGAARNVAKLIKDGPMCWNDFWLIIESLDERVRERKLRTNRSIYFNSTWPKKVRARQAEIRKAQEAASHA